MTTHYRLSENDFRALFEAVRSRYDRVIGPTVREGAIVYESLDCLDDLPRGFRDEQSPARYRVTNGTSRQWFGFANPTQSLKSWFHPPRERLYTLRRKADGVALEPEPTTARRLAIFGAKSCDLEGLQRLDQVMLSGEHPDVRYLARRRDTLLIAVQCTTPADTCFCVSMGTGPRAKSFDLALTELPTEGASEFLLEVGSVEGAKLIADLDFSPALPELSDRARRSVEQAAERQRHRVNAEGARHALAASLQDTRWNDIAERCLACSNCTASCPTCFCSSFQEENAFDQQRTERWRQTDSCFGDDFSYIHGGLVRPSIAARYRQWLTHKFSTWHDQFGTSGCVGCGRCVTWCPVGIDVRQELAAFCAGHEPPPDTPAETNTPEPDGPPPPQLDRTP